MLDPARHIRNLSSEDGGDPAWSSPNDDRKAGPSRQRRPKRDSSATREGSRLANSAPPSEIVDRRGVEVADRSRATSIGYFDRYPERKRNGPYIPKSSLTPTLKSRSEEGKMPARNLKHFSPQSNSSQALPTTPAQSAIRAMKVSRGKDLIHHSPQASGAISSSSPGAELQNACSPEPPQGAQSKRSNRTVDVAIHNPRAWNLDREKSPFDDSTASSLQSISPSAFVTGKENSDQVPNFSADKQEDQCSRPLSRRVGTIPKMHVAQSLHTPRKCDSTLVQQARSNLASECHSSAVSGTFAASTAGMGKSSGRNAHLITGKIPTIEEIIRAYRPPVTDSPTHHSHGRNPLLLNQRSPEKDAPRSSWAAKTSDKDPKPLLKMFPHRTRSSNRLVSEDEGCNDSDSSSSSIGSIEREIRDSLRQYGKISAPKSPRIGETHIQDGDRHRQSDRARCNVSSAENTSDLQATSSLDLSAAVGSNGQKRSDSSSSCRSVGVKDEDSPRPELQHLRRTASSTGMKLNRETHTTATAALPEEKTHNFASGEQFAAAKERDGSGKFSSATRRYLSSSRLTRLLTLSRSANRGLTVSLADVGSAEGSPVFVFLGLGAVRYLVGLYDEMASALGLRLICVDRWGLGKSDDVPSERRSILDWSSVVMEVADVLGLTTFSLMAHSAGAPYAMATVLMARDRIAGPVHLLSPWIGPSTESGYKWLKYIPDGVLRTAQVAEWKLQGWKLGKSPTVDRQGGEATRTPKYDGEAKASSWSSDSPLATSDFHDSPSSPIETQAQASINRESTRSPQWSMASASDLAPPFSTEGANGDEALIFSSPKIASTDLSDSPSLRLKSSDRQPPLTKSVRNKGSFLGQLFSPKAPQLSTGMFPMSSDCRLRASPDVFGPKADAADSSRRLSLSRISLPDSVTCGDHQTKALTQPRRSMSSREMFLSDDTSTDTCAFEVSNGHARFPDASVSPGSWDPSSSTEKFEFDDKLSSSRPSHAEPRNPELEEASKELGVALLRASHAESLRGSTPDLMVILGRKPWGFSFADVNHPCKVWHGSRDERISLSSAKWMEKELRDCHLTIVEGAGHNLMSNSEVVVEVLESIAMSTRHQLLR